MKPPAALADLLRAMAYGGIKKSSNGLIYLAAALNDVGARVASDEEYFDRVWPVCLAWNLGLGSICHRAVTSTAISVASVCVSAPVIPAQRAGALRVAASTVGRAIDWLIPPPRVADQGWL